MCLAVRVPSLPVRLSSEQLLRQATLGCRFRIGNLGTPDGFGLLKDSAQIVANPLRAGTSDACDGCSPFAVIAVRDNRAAHACSRRRLHRRFMGFSCLSKLILVLRTDYAKIAAHAGRPRPVHGWNELVCSPWL